MVVEIDQGFVKVMKSLWGMGSLSVRGKGRGGRGPSVIRRDTEIPNKRKTDYPNFRYYPNVKYVTVNEFLETGEAASRRR